MSDDPVADLMARIDKERSTPEGRARLDKKFLQWDEEKRLREGSMRAAELDILAVCEKHYPRGDNNDIDSPSMLAAALDYFTLDDSENNPAQLYLEWAVEELAGRKLMAGLDDIRAIYNTLVERGCDSEAKSHEWNDCDNTLFYLPHDTKQVWCATSQNTNYMYILDGNKFHIRRYWDAVALAAEWEIDDRAKYNRVGFEYAVEMADGLTERWSDNLLDNRYVRRPDRQWWADKDYEPQYGDCRDNGYVLSIDIGPNAYRHRVDRAIYVMQDLKIAFFEIQCALRTLDI